MKKSKEPGTPPAGPALKRRRIALPRTRRRRAAAAAGGLLVFLLILLACATLGDPLSRAYSRYHAVDWANETWPGHDFRVTDVQFEPFWCYYVTVQASDSIDTHFTLTVVAGIVRRTDYELAVANLQNTKQRFFDSLHSDVQNALTAAGYAPVSGSDFSVTVGDPNLAMDHTLTRQGEHPAQDEPVGQWLVGCPRRRTGESDPAGSVPDHHRGGHRHRRICRHHLRCLLCRPVRSVSRRRQPGRYL